MDLPVLQDIPVTLVQPDLLVILVLQVQLGQQGLLEQLD
jgi:hypothetical protein